MLITLVSYAVMLFCFIAIGLTFQLVFEKLFDYKFKRITSVIMMGLSFSIIYSQTFSIFSKVSAQAFYILLIVSILSIIINIKSVVEWKNKLLLIEKKELLLVSSIIFVVSLISAYMACGIPTGFDTSNYHIPSIRWIEEYGVVKGLGNLHTRFAYNSSFLCLQALFSFKWILNDSLHSMNGFIWLFFVLYSLFSKKRINEIRLSLILRFVFLSILLRLDMINSIVNPDTDFLPMCLAAYIFIEWSKLNEDKEENVAPYGLLCVLACVAITVKLSVAILVLFSINPIIVLIKIRKKKEIIIYSVIGILVSLPYVIRNVIISGYLLYPVASLDIFNFDWEIPKSVVLSDSVAIKLFARGNGDWNYSDINLNILSWITLWVRKTNNTSGFWAFLSLLLIVVMIIYLLVNRKKKFEYDNILYYMIIICFCFWFFTAPGIRFGKWWIYSIPAFTVWLVIFENREKCVIKIENIKCMLIKLLIMCSIFIFLWFGDAKIVNGIRWIVFPKNYTNENATSKYIDINGIKFYYYKDENKEKVGGLNAYDGFPGTECVNTIYRIEMRGESLADGFRVKNEYKNIPYGFQGNILNEDEIKNIGINKYY